MDRRFDEARADRVVHFFERVLVHTKSRYAGKPFLLAPWQRDDILRPLFGTVRFDPELDEWVRQYVLAWIELAKKNGKSEVLAGCGLYLVSADGEEGAEVYGCACDRDQAGIVYQVAKRMVELSPVLSNATHRGKRRFEIIDSKKRIVDRKTESFYQVVAADAAGNYGQNPHGVLFDEVITQPSRDLWDAFEQALGNTRAQAMMLAATTAGNDPSSFAAEEHLHAEKVVQDPSLDPSRFVYMRNTPADANWEDEANWAFANPAIDDFKRRQSMRDLAVKAKMSLARQNAFRQFHLNQWVRQVTRWLDMGVWDANAGLIVEEQLAGRQCYGGLDLASTADFAAWLLLFPGEEYDEVLARFFLPRAAVERRSPMRDQLEAWEADGFLKVTPGEVIDYDAIEAQIDRDAQDFVILGAGYDRWNATQLVTKLEDGGLDMRPLPQTTTALNGPSKELDRRLGLKRLRHGGHPVLRWMADNVELFTDSAGNIKPDKKRSKEKIDGVVALVMAIAVQLSENAGQDFAVMA